MDAENRQTLSVEQIKDYKEKGYLLTGKTLFSPQKFQVLHGIFEHLLATKGNSQGDELDVPHFSNERLFEFLLAEEVLDIVECLIGPNIGLWSSHFICKEAQTGARTPWHEDSAYWKGRFDRYDDIVTLWLAIDESNQENGCMGVVPGTHQNGFSEHSNMDTEHKIFNIEIQEEKVPLEKVRWFELQQNQYSLHDSRIIHGANANTSKTRRTGFTMRYFNSDLKMAQNHPDNLNHKVYHCRGENRGGNKLIVL